MLLPIGHDRQATTPVPFVTIGIIALALAVGIYTLTLGRAQQNKLETSLTQLSDWAVLNPGATLSEEAISRLGNLPPLDAGVREKAASLLQQSQSPAPPDAPPVSIEAQTEMGIRCAGFVRTYEELWLHQLPLTPSKHRASFLHYPMTMFFHFGIAHLLLSVLLLWIAGVFVEDLWGSPIFAGVTLVCGLIAAAIFTLMNAQSTVPAMGLSGASAGLMGAFLARLFTSRVRLAYWTPIIKGRLELPAFTMGIVWGLQIMALEFLTFKTGVRTGYGLVAHLATFAIGAGLSFALAAMKLEKYYVRGNAASQVEIASSREIQKALHLLEQGNSKDAIQKIHDFMLDHPEDLGALNGLLHIYKQINQRNLTDATYHRIIAAYVEKNDRAKALEAYRTMRGDRPEGTLPPPIPAREWTILCDYLMELKELDEVTLEFEKLGEAHPSHALAVRAMVFAAEIQMNHKNNRERAEELFRKAAALRPTNPMWQKRVIDGLAKVEKAQLQATATRRR